MVKAALRTKSIGSKVTEEEYARLEELAGVTGQSMSEWVRTILIEQLEQRAAKATEETVLAELLGLRTILLNLLFTVAKGEVISAEQMQAVIERADAGKMEAGAEAAGDESRRGAAVSQWGRKAYQRWPSRKPVWTLSAFFGAVLFFALASAAQYARTGRSSSGSICRCTRRPGYTGCSRRRRRGTASSTA